MSVKLHAGESASYVQQTVSWLKPNTKYILTGWAKTSDPVKKMLIGVRDYDGVGSAKNGLIEGSTYVQGTVEFKTGADTTSIIINAWKGPGNFDGYVDDYILTEKNNWTISRKTAR